MFVKTFLKGVFGFLVVMWSKGKSSFDCFSDLYIELFVNSFDAFWSLESFMLDIIRNDLSVILEVFFFWWWGIFLLFICLLLGRCHSILMKARNQYEECALCMTRQLLSLQPGKVEHYFFLMKFCQFTFKN